MDPENEDKMLETFRTEQQQKQQQKRIQQDKKYRIQSSRMKTKDKVNRQ